MGLAEVITIVAGFVTVLWFIWDINRRNGKLQKTSLEVQKTSLEVQKTSLEVLHKIEEGQRKGFETLALILAKIEQNTRKD